MVEETAPHTAVRGLHPNWRIARYDMDAWSNRVGRERSLRATLADRTRIADPLSPLSLAWFLSRLQGHGGPWFLLLRCRVVRRRVRSVRWERALGSEFLVA